MIKLNTNRLFEMKIERKIRSQGTSAGLQIIFFSLERKQNKNLVGHAKNKKSKIEKPMNTNKHFAIIKKIKFYCIIYIFTFL